MVDGNIAYEHCRKLADTPFPFPFSQMMVVVLLGEGPHCTRGGGGGPPNAALAGCRHLGSRIACAQVMVVVVLGEGPHCLCACARPPWPTTVNFTLNFLLQASPSRCPSSWWPA